MSLPEKAQQSLDVVIKRFKEGKLPKAMAQTVIQGEGRPLDGWSFHNQVIAFAHDTTDARGYKQWQKVDRQVKKGASAFYIFGPIIKTEEKENEEGEAEEEEVLVGFHPIPVFAKEDTEGEPLEYEPEELPPLQDVVERLGYEVEYVPQNGNARGATMPGLETIELNTEDARTWFHELAHAVHNEIENLKSGQWDDQEIIAESVAAVLCELYGFEGFLEHSADYLEHYGDDPYEAIMQYLDKVKQVLEHVFELQAQKA